MNENMTHFVHKYKSIQLDIYFAKGYYFYRIYLLIDFYL